MPSLECQSVRMREEYEAVSPSRSFISILLNSRLTRLLTNAGAAMRHV
jgi:hypothetical protein